jgi:hypothetical protein
MQNLHSSARTAAKTKFKSWGLTTSAKIATILLLAAVFSSCEPQSKDGTKTDTKYTSLACDIKVVTIDSCEYIVAQAGRIDGGLSIVHKQNCKYCAGRK